MPLWIRLVTPLVFFAIGGNIACSDGHESESSKSGNEKQDGVTDEPSAAVLQPVDLAFLIPALSEGSSHPGHGDDPEHIRLDELLARRTFETLLEHEPDRLTAASQVGASDIYSQTFVTGIRFHLEPDTNHAELRFVAQPWLRFSNAGYLDVALHLVYRIPGDEVDLAIEAFETIKAECQERLAERELQFPEVPVGLHPCLIGLPRAEGLAFIDGTIKPSLAQFATEDRLTGVATMILASASTWRWSLFDTEDTEEGVKLRRIDLATIDELSGVGSCSEDDRACVRGGMASRGRSAFVPLPVAEISRPSLLLAEFEPDQLVFPTELLSTEPEPAESDLPLVAATATMLLNPRLTRIADLERNVGGVDCASCHLQQNRLEDLEREHPSLMQELAPVLETVAYQPPEGLHCDVDPVAQRRAEGAWKVINFGLLGRDDDNEGSNVSLNPRTVHEACEVAASVARRRG